MGRRVVAWVFATGCGPVVSAGDGETSTSGMSSTTASPTTETPSTSSEPSGPTSLSTSATTDPVTTDPVTTDPVTTDPVTTDSVTSIDGSSGYDTCGDFVCPPDFTSGPPPCDIWSSDCPEGEKCMPWANDGGERWNDTGCFPVDPFAVNPGDECVVEGAPTSGLDNCQIGSMCFFVDLETNVGVCVSLCTGKPNDPVCEDPSTACAVELDATLVACLPACDPLLQDCAQGSCHPTGDAFVCAPTFGVGLSAGQTCEHEWECAAGYTCFDGVHVPDCAGDRCCAPFCDVTEPGQCEASTCDPWYRPGQSPGLDPPTGVCIVE